MTSIESFVWPYKYQPTTVDQLIATVDMKQTVSKILENNQIPNMLFVGPSGVGKTSIARLIANATNSDYVIINASLKGNIDTLRNEIQAFASARSLDGGKKLVILDEADYLSAATQPALRNFIDTYESNCGFILTANYRNKIIVPLQERLETYTFTITPKELPSLALQFTKRIKEILALENVKYDFSVIAQLVMAKAPNWRSILLTLQKYAREHGEIDSGILAKVSGADLDTLIPLIRKKDYTAIRRWVGENAATAGPEILTELVVALEPIVFPAYLPDLIVTVARYQYQAAFAIDQQINLSAALAEIMLEGRFND